jgi:hypothetical protein
MPRYFIDTHDGDNALSDRSGFEFADAAAACAASIHALKDMANDHLALDRSRIFKVVVRGPDKHPLYSASLAFTSQWAVGLSGNPDQSSR